MRRYFVISIVALVCACLQIKADTVCDTLHITAIAGQEIERQFVLQDEILSNHEIELEYDENLFQSSLDELKLTITYTPLEEGVVESEVKLKVDKLVSVKKHLIFTTLPELFMITANYGDYTYLLSGKENNISDAIVADKVKTSKFNVSYYDTIYAWRPELTEDSLEIYTLRGTRLSGVRYTSGLTTGVSSLNTGALGKWIVRPGKESGAVKFINGQKNTSCLGLKKAADYDEKNLFGNYKDDDYLEIRPVRYKRKPVPEEPDEPNNPDEPDEPDVGTEDTYNSDNIHIYLQDNKLYIDNINDNSVVKIYALNGDELYSGRVVGDCFECLLPYKGFYILAIENGKDKLFKKIIL